MSRSAVKKSRYGSRAAVVLEGRVVGGLLCEERAKEDVTEVRLLEENIRTGIMVQLSG